MPAEHIRPLKDVWLRPRRVFRELATHPVDRTDYLLGAAQGVVGWLTASRTTNAGATESIVQILGKAALFGPIAGVASLFLFAEIYTRLSRRMGVRAPRDQVVHVLAYGSMPIAASLGIWVLIALIAGEPTFIQTHAPEEGFLAMLFYAQSAANALLMIWSAVLQIMGFSEIQGLLTRRAFGIWLLGQLIGLLAALVLLWLIEALLPAAGPG